MGFVTFFSKKVRRVAADKSRFDLYNAKVKQSHEVVCARLKNLLLASRRGQITLWFAQCESKAVARGSLILYYLFKKQKLQNIIRA